MVESSYGMLEKTVSITMQTHVHVSLKVSRCGTKGQSLFAVTAQAAFT